VGGLTVLRDFFARLRARAFVARRRRLDAFARMVFLVLPTDGSEVEGRHLRVILAERGWPLSGPAFYARMAELEDAGYVEGRWRASVVAGTTVRQRVYRVPRPE
jgi:hypothetical protein